jgi:alkylated DNA repair dioxygenase AlkB
LAHIPERNIVQALITEYTPGAGVGWHCDNERCENVIGISLAGWADMQLRPLPRHGDQKDVTRLSLEPRSAYLMQLDSRWKYQHRIMPVETLRYSITFRTT